MSKLVHSLAENFFERPEILIVLNMQIMVILVVMPCNWCTQTSFHCCLYLQGTKASHVEEEMKAGEKLGLWMNQWKDVALKKIFTLLVLQKYLVLIRLNPLLCPQFLVLVIPNLLSIPFFSNRAYSHMNMEAEQCPETLVRGIITQTQQSPLSILCSLCEGLCIASNFRLEYTCYIL